MQKPLSEVRRIFLLLVWLTALGVVVLLGMDPASRFSSNDLVSTLRLWIPLIVAGLITLIVHQFPRA
jgi:hypothetical protein